MDSSSTNDEQRRTSSSRRTFLATTATLGALGLAGCGGNGGDSTPTPDPTSTPTDSPTDTQSPTETDQPTTGTDSNAAPDVPVLNYALTLEHLENALYREGLNQYGAEDLRGADVLAGVGDSIRTAVPDSLETVSAHEAAHVELLTERIEALGGTPVEEAEYDFDYQTPSEFLALARSLENTGVAGYAGAAGQVVDNDVLAAAAGIHSVEARHASVLNLINDTEPYLDAVDEALSVFEGLAAAGGFITSDVDPSVYELGEDRPNPDRTADDETDDVEVLNYALTLEHLENAFYREGLATFSDEELASADALSGFDESVRTAVPNYVRTAGGHEAAHVRALSVRVESLGGTPVEEAEYDFGYETPSEFLALAKTLENTGVAAYAGAAPTIADDDVFDTAISVHSVEARHAGLFNQLNGESPFPDRVDEPMSMTEVRDVVSEFVVEE